MKPSLLDIKGLLLILEIAATLANNLPKDNKKLANLNKAIKYLI